MNNELTDDEKYILQNQLSMVNTIREMIKECNGDKKLLEIGEKIVTFNHDNYTFMELLAEFSRRYKRLID